MQLGTHLCDRILIMCLFKRPKSSRYCRQPLLNNLLASIALSFIASGESSETKMHKQYFTALRTN